MRDLLIIGGGINGLGIAADAARRGLSVLLAEKGDFGGGTTATSSRLIHGGLRYLQYGEMGLVAESLRERSLLVRQWPHLVRPIQLLIPDYRGDIMPGWKVGIGLRLYSLLGRDGLFPAARGLSLTQCLEREPGLGREGLAGGHIYPDGQISFPERLCVELMRQVVAHGGETLNHTRVTGLKCVDDRVSGALLRDEITGEEQEVEARLTLNVAGPWVDQVNALLPEQPPRLVGGTWGSHVVLPLRPEGPRGHLYANARKDGRPFFILPWDGRLLVGTTDVPFEGDLDRLQVQEWEIDYLLSETNALFPGAAYTPADVQHTTIGVRPLPLSKSAAGTKTRRHFLVDHEKQHRIAGLASVVGGKLTTFRSLAEEVVDWSLRALGKPAVPCPTRAAPEYRTVPAGDRLRGLYTDPGEIMALQRRDPALAEPLVPGSPITRAEVVHVIETERARTVDDVLLRRLMVLPPSAELTKAVAEALAEARPTAARESL